ncbi:MAG: phytanoyl-CoA dioxygenase [Planctomycetaceae bacterium]|nr:phytanoyl-CoA dioxygenase [Planctomycetaceae bacterium]
MFDQKYKQDYDRDGFVVVREFLQGDDLRQLTSNLDRYIRDVVPTLPDGSAFFQNRSDPESLKQLQHMDDAFFDEYRQHPRWCELATLLVGEPINVQGPEWFNKPPGAEHPTPPHQDNYYFCLKPANVVTLWLALDSTDEENGCIRYVRGSHREGVRSHNATEVLGFSQGITDYGDDDEARAVPMCLQPGDLIAHHGETVHRADPNRSNRSRRAFAMVCRGVSCQRDEEAYGRYMSAMKQQHSSMGLEAI